MTLCPGDLSTATLAIYNSGVFGWHRAGWPAQLGTWNPSPGQDQPSVVGGDGTATFAGSLQPNAAHGVEATTVICQKMP